MEIPQGILRSNFKLPPRPEFFPNPEPKRVVPLPVMDLYPDENTRLQQHQTARTQNGTFAKIEQDIAEIKAEVTAQSRLLMAIADVLDARDPKEEKYDEPEGFPL